MQRYPDLEIISLKNTNDTKLQNFIVLEKSQMKMFGSENSKKKTTRLEMYARIIFIGNT